MPLQGTVPRRRHQRSVRQGSLGVLTRRESNSISDLIKRKLLNDKEKRVICRTHGPQSLGAGTWYIDRMFDIAQGDGPTNRDGLQCKGLYANVRMSLTSPTDRVSYVRIMIIRWKDTADSAPDDANMPADHLSCVSAVQRNKYAVLYDKVFALNPRTTGTAEDSSVMFRKIHVKDKTLKKYVTAAAELAHSGQLFFCALQGSNYSGGTDDPEVHAETEFVFVD